MAEQCYIWNIPAKYEVSSRDGEYVVSPRAGGKYFIAGTAIGILQNRDAELPVKQKVILSDWIFRQNQIGVIPELTSAILEWSASAKIKSTLERAHGLLLSMGLETTFIGEKLGWFRNLALIDVTISDRAYAASSSTKSDEVIYLARYLFEEGMISDWGHVLGFQIEPKGFQFLDSKGIFNAQNKQVFVAMWFAEEMDLVYRDGVREAVSECGYVPFRIDEKHHNNKIDDEIIRGAYLIRSLDDRTGRSSPTGSRDGRVERLSVRTERVPDLLHREATAVNSNSGPLESPSKDG